MGDQAVDACGAGQLDSAFGKGHHDRYFFDWHLGVAPNQARKLGNGLAGDT